MASSKVYYTHQIPLGKSNRCKASLLEKNIGNNFKGNSLAVQRLGLHAFTTAGRGSVPGWRTKIPQASGVAKTKTKHQKPILNLQVVQKEQRDGSDLKAWFASPCLGG